MNIGIYDIGKCGTDLSILERFTIYKSAGFTHVGFYLDDDYLEGESYLDMIQVARDLGLNIDQVHLDYKNSNMWAETTENEFLDYVNSKIDEAIKYNIPHIVLHASKGDNPPLISPFSLNKLVHFDKKLNDSGTKLCFENVRNSNNIDAVMDLKLANIGVCYDSGHAHCYSDEMGILQKYKDVIYCTHLHDNDGSDTHELIGNGSIEWDTMYPAICDTNREVDYLECFMPRGITANKDMFKAFVVDAYNSYVELGEN
jgi:sugar phosphate isomerase/epimerase